MAQLNTTPRTPHRTHEGAPALALGAHATLRRLVLTALLWEDQFYVDGVTIAQGIRDLVPRVAPELVAQLAVEAREGAKLRHVPLLLVREMARHDTHRPLVTETLARVIQRPDELTEFLALYWQDGRTPVAASVKRGLAQAFGKFDEYALAKYNRDKTVKLRDVLRIAHPRPSSEAQADLWRRLSKGELATPDTWETQLSAGADKRATWERLLQERKLGGLALLRNLRGMHEAGVPDAAVRAGLRQMRTDRVLPYRFIAAARHASHLEPELEDAMLRSLTELPRLAGHTVLLIDVSGSMSAPLSARSDLSRLDAAAGLAMMARELCETCEVFTFSTILRQLPARRGFALRDAIGRPSGGTHLGAAVRHFQDRPHDRLIVLTDEESQDVVGAPRSGVQGYMINVASTKRTVGFGPWTRLTGFSEQVLSWIQAQEVSDT
ncbi:TROVE domain-containing protein [Deinococcus sp. 12RED42]|uniref:TROVE domain-containing protein n=1 Tax=Deinococcus sp. 12RED42 TaxID=2745872 RepID=UPI001E431239|nr:TROVE domain-containing protein [Deinococcus sp. 12RED42]MCD0165198.1 TROVE domain-containing protein [Deinococcus sp. 12RED42]